MKLGGLRHYSLATRLAVLAAGWSLIVIIAAGAGVSYFVQRTVLGRFDRTLSEQLDNLVAGVQVNAQGQLVPPTSTDTRALRGFSGRYWVVGEPIMGGGIVEVARSQSLGDAPTLALPPGGVRAVGAQAGQPLYYDIEGPLDQNLRAAAIQVRLGNPWIPVIFLVAEDRAAVDEDARNLAIVATLAMALLGVGMIAAVFIQVRFGLQPLYALRREIAEVRNGKKQRLGGRYPVELTPLADELNALVAHNQDVVERQRTHVGNLAHALKTPISVMMTEAEQQPGALAEVVARQAQVMRDQVDHHLRRARAAARSQGQGERTSVASVLDELARTLERVFMDRGVEIDWRADEDLFFLGERQDLLEIAGNALENACKYGDRRVRAVAEPTAPNRFTLRIEDDGEGLPPARWDLVLRRGARLDESEPGSGLGLSIIDELARAYGGAVTLGQAPLGGLLVSIDLPRAAR